MPSITMPAEFFRGELRMYSRWREAFVREVLQNAVDADANHIRVTIGVTDDGAVQATVADDGHGMTRETLEQVFFALGRTTKHTGDTIGGFGRARIILCFAQRQYRIRCSTVLVKGQGGSYHLTDNLEEHDGVTFTIDLVDDDPQLIREAFASVLATCDLPTQVTVDGQTFPGCVTPSRARRVLRDDDGPWARVYLTDVGPPQMRVRVSGLTMFSRRVAASSSVVLVELVPGRVRQLLTASRDGLQWPYAGQLSEFVDDLAGNRRRALQERPDPLHLRVVDGGFTTTEGGVAGSSDVPQVAARQAGPHQQQGRRATSSSGRPEGARQLRQSGVRVGFDVFLFAANLDSRVRQLVRRWDPSRWNSSGVGQRRRKLLLTWSEAVTVAVDALLEAHPQAGEVRWTVGWTFDEDVEATHEKVEDGSHVLALNPVDENGRTRWQLTSSEDRRTLRALAVHEVCHLLAGTHDEQFANLQTDVHATLNEAAADRRMVAARQR